MSTHYVKIGDVEQIVTLEGGEITLDGVRVNAEIAPAGNGLYAVTLDGESFRVVLSAEPAGAPAGAPDTLTATCGGITETLLVEGARSRLLRQFSKVTGELDRKMEVHAPMPALVVRVEVEVGQQVAQGDRLIVLEAMKMENELSARHAGSVKEILVQKGKSVEKGELLLRLE